MHIVSDGETRSPRLHQEGNDRDRALGIILDNPFVPFIAAVTLLIPSVVWALRDARVWPWDQAYYAALALQIRSALHDGLLAWLSALLSVPDSRAPLLPWLAQVTMPLTRILGSPEPALLLTNIAAGAITLGLVYSATRRLGGTRAVALTAMLACAGTSHFIALNHQFLVEAGQAMTIAGLAWISLRADEASWTRLAAGTLFWVTLAMLAKTTSAGYVLPFLLYIGITCSVSEHRRSAAKPRDFILLFGAALLAALAIAWYAMHWSGVVAHIREATTDDGVVFYGSDRPLIPKLQFWSIALLQCLSPFPWLAGLVLIAAFCAIGVSLAGLGRHGFMILLRKSIQSRILFALCLVGTMVAGLLTYSKMIAEDARYLAPMVPLVVLLFAWSLARLRRRYVTAAAAVLVAGNWIATHAMAQGLLATSPTTLGYLQAPQSHPAEIARMARAVREVCEKSRAGRVDFIGAELSDFGVTSASFYAEKMRRATGYRCGYASFRPLESDLNRAIRILYDVDADFFLTLPLDRLPAPGTDPLNRVSRPLAEWVAASPDFERVTAGGDILAIYRRRR